jgi:hypothetical protein
MQWNGTKTLFLTLTLILTLTLTLTLTDAVEWDENGTIRFRTNSYTNAMQHNHNVAITTTTTTTTTSTATTYNAVTNDTAGVDLTGNIVLREEGERDRNTTNPNPNPNSNPNSNPTDAEVDRSNPATENTAELETASFQTKMRAIGKSRENWVITYAFLVCGITTTGFIETHIVGFATARNMTEAR